MLEKLILCACYAVKSNNSFCYCFVVVQRVTAGSDDVAAVTDSTVTDPTVTGGGGFRGVFNRSQTRVGSALAGLNPFGKQQRNGHASSNATTSSNSSAIAAAAGI
jgi:hypothetical protein